MSWWQRVLGRSAPKPPTEAQKVTRNVHRDHLTDFARTRQHVEAFMEPATTINTMTLLLVARDGEWTRRPVPDEKTARSFAKDAKIPIFDVNQSGYPSAMREYNARQKQARKQR